MSEARSQTRRCVWIALAASAVATAVKFAAAFDTGASVLLTEAVHSMLDASSQLMLLHGLRQARAQPPRSGAPAFWSLVVAILLFAAGAGVAISEGLARSARPATLADVRLGALALGAALPLEMFAAYTALMALGRATGRPQDQLKTARDPVLFTVLIETLAAIAGICAAGAGLAAARWGSVPEADGLASIAIGLILALVAALCAVEVKGVLAGIGQSGEARAGDPIASTAAAPEVATAASVAPATQALAAGTQAPSVQPPQAHSAQPPAKSTAPGRATSSKKKRRKQR